MKFRIILFLLVFLVTGCGRFSHVGSLEGILSDSGERPDLLQKRLAEFHREVYWGNQAFASRYVAPEARATFYSQLGPKNSSERIASLPQIVNVDYDEDIVTASVKVLIKAFGSPSFTIKERHHEETWEFRRFDSGWLLTEVKALEGEETSKSTPGLGS